MNYNIFWIELCEKISYFKFILIFISIINPLASPSAGDPALKYGDVNTVTPSPGEVKGLIVNSYFLRLLESHESGLFESFSKNFI